jgi:hypothetical protein
MDLLTRGSIRSWPISACNPLPLYRETASGDEEAGICHAYDHHLTVEGLRAVLHGCVCHDDADPLRSDSKYRARASETSVSSSALSKWPV